MMLCTAGPAKNGCLLLVVLKNYLDLIDNPGCEFVMWL